MLASAAGRAYLAFCSAQQRDTMLELHARSSLPETVVTNDDQKLGTVVAERDDCVIIETGAVSSVTAAQIARLQM